MTNATHSLQSPEIPALLQKQRMNPLIATAAVAVIAFSAVGIAAMTGLLPGANSQQGVEHSETRAPTSIASVQSAVQPAAQYTAPVAVRPAARPAPQRPALYARSEPQPVQRNAQICASCGTVEAVRTVEVKGQSSGVGMVAGGVGGALLGNQMGRGNGNTAMTILGAAGGALAGNEIEKHVKKQYSYRVTVRMEDGSYRTMSQSSRPNVAVGEKVRINDGVVIARS